MRISIHAGFGSSVGDLRTVSSAAAYWNARRGPASRQLIAFTDKATPHRNSSTRPVAEAVVRWTVGADFAGRLRTFRDWMYIPAINARAGTSSQPLQARKHARHPLEKRESHAKPRIPLRPLAPLTRMRVAAVRRLTQSVCRL